MVFGMHLISIAARIFLAGWLISGLLTINAQADMGPALSGLTAQASDASSVFWSPAGITRLDREELLVGATLVGLESSFGVDESNVNGGDADDDTSILAIPSIFYAHPLNERWHVGASLTVPSGFGNQYGNRWSGRYLAEEAELTFVALAGTVGYRFDEQWSIGGGPILMYADSLTKARINNPVGSDGRIELEEDGVGFGWQLGLMHEFSERTRVAAVYRSEVDPDLSGKPKLNNIDPLLKAGLDALGLLDEDIDVDFVVPEQVQLGVYHEFIDDWSFTADVMWINMSKFGINHVSVDSAQVSLNGSFRDNWLFSLGIRHQYRPDLAFSAGGLYMTSPVSDNNRIIALPLDRVIAFGAGVDWRWRGIEIHNSLTYADLGDGKLDQDGGLAGRIEGSFDSNYAVVLDTQFTWRF
jgi:long-chain fatty acid transport protein